MFVVLLIVGMLSAQIESKVMKKMKTGWVNIPLMLRMAAAYGMEDKPIIAKMQTRLPVFLIL